ncbi:hypothetical protein [Paenarthrobacter sp. NPDC091669]|uniref:hypothetical protein n=1 Tax=Paenarthrobacter sp. NPDC091669 TaxID=3364384 RepID=UPI00380F329E
MLSKFSHPVLRISVLAGLVFVFVVIFLSYQTKDSSIPVGTRGQFFITATTSVPGEAIQAIEQAAAVSGQNIYKQGTNPSETGAAPWYFSFVGNKLLHEQNMGANEYPSFDPATKPEVFVADLLIDQGVVGAYVTTADASELARIINVLNDAGIDTEVIRHSDAEIFLSGVFGTAAAPTLIALLLALSLSIVYASAHNRRSTAIQILHGYSVARTGVSEVLAFTRFFAIASFGLLFGATLFLTFYNGLNQYASFMAWLGVGLVAVFSFMTAIYILALIFQRAIDPLRLLKGDQSFRTLGVAAGVTQIASVVLVYAVATSSMASYVSLDADSVSVDRWAAERGSVTLQINPHTLNDRDPERIDPAVRKVFRDFGDTYNNLDRIGAAVLAIHPRKDASRPPAPGYSAYNPDTGNSLIVNNNYLARNQILSEEGDPVRQLPSLENGIHLLIPEGARAQTAKIVAEYQNLNWHKWELGVPSESYPPLDVSVVYTKDHQDVFNYGDTWDMKNWTQTDPVIAVVSPESDVFSGWYLLTVAANSGNVIFTDDAVFKAAAANSGLERHLVAVTAPALRAIDDLNKRTATMTLNATNVGVSLLVLFLAIGVLAAIYIDRNKRSIFLKYIHGWNFLRTHGFYLVVITMGSAVALLLSTNAVSGLLRADKLASLVLAGVVLCISLTGVAVAVSTYESKMRGENVKRT